MQGSDETAALRRILDRQEIQDLLCAYARGVDRGDWELVRRAYHPDAYDDHAGYRGSVDGLIAWLQERFADVDNSMHFLGNCLIEPAGPDRALVETSFVSSRLRVPEEGEGDAVYRQTWGRYLDRFERRGGVWRIARRQVVVEARFTAPVDAAPRGVGGAWGMRDASDPLYAERAALGLGR